MDVFRFLTLLHSLCLTLLVAVVLRSSIVPDDLLVFIGKESQWDGSGMTLYGTVAPGSTASLTFTGTSIGVYGTIFAGNTNPQSTYSIDGTVLGSYTEPLSNYTQYNHLLWQSQPLPNSAHTIVVTYHSGIGFWLDYMQYGTQAASATPSPIPSSTPPSPAVVNPSPTQTTPTSTGSSSSLTTTGTKASDSPSLTQSSSVANPSTTSQISTSLSQGTSLPTLASSSPSQSNPTPAASSSTKNIIGPIVGGVVGGLLLLCLLVFLGLRWKRRSREEAVLRPSTPIMQNPGPNFMRPFTGMASPNTQDAGMFAFQHAAHQDYAIHGGTAHEKVGLRNARPSQSDSYGSSSMYTRSHGTTEPSPSPHIHLMTPAHDQESAYGAYLEAPPEYGDLPAR